jgi:hypothetical protein
MVNAQERTFVEGQITYLSRENVYVRFAQNSDINVNDTLYIKSGNTYEAALIVSKKSSLSCLTTKIGNQILAKDQSIFSKIKVPIIPKEETAKPTNSTAPEVVVLSDTTLRSSIENETPRDKNSLRENYSLRFTSSTNGILASEGNSNQRIRLSLDVNLKNMNNSRWSTQSYVTYRHRYGIDQQTAFFNDFKVFNLYAVYNDQKKNTLMIGRNFNQRIANIGAVDGIQYERKLKQWMAGVFTGSRPDVFDYSYNFRLAQTGLYIAHDLNKSKIFAQSSLAFVQQWFDWKTDRRFLYLQHNATIAKDVNLFASSELDLYQRIDSVSSNNPVLTSAYISLRYRPSRKISFSAAYDNRRNVIYYESQILLVDQLLAQETRQGVRFGIQTNFIKNLHIGTTAFYRYQNSFDQPTKNYTINAHMNNFTPLKLIFGANYNLIQTYYFDGTIYGARLSRDIFKSKANVELNYRYIDYAYKTSEQTIRQQVFGINTSIYLTNTSFILLNYEGTFDVNDDYHRYFISFSKRLRDFTKPKTIQ